MPEWRYLLLLVVVYLWVHMMHTVARFIADVALKWLVIGRRKPGLYPWDRSSYCLRWKMLEMVCSDTLKDLRLLGGSAFLPFYYNVVGAKIGRRVCLYPTGADPPMVEPDLVVIEDLACINFAHIICHTNTLGSFALNTIVVKSGATLSTESRVMGGVVIGEDAVLLEHTLAMVGDQVEPETIWQGWPVHTIARVDEVNSGDHSHHHAPANAPANPLYSPRGRVEDVDATRSGPDAASVASLAGLRGGGGNDVSNYHSSYGMV
jgi:acetyltransferase-like isoleucine patch superfamily enzyme